MLEAALRFIRSSVSQRPDLGAPLAPSDDAARDDGPTPSDSPCPISASHGRSLPRRSRRGPRATGSSVTVRAPPVADMASREPRSVPAPVHFLRGFKSWASRLVATASYAAARTDAGSNGRGTYPACDLQQIVRQDYPAAVSSRYLLASAAASVRPLRTGAVSQAVLDARSRLRRDRMSAPSLESASVRIDADYARWLPTTDRMPRDSDRPRRRQTRRRESAYVAHGAPVEQASLAARG